MILLYKRGQLTSRYRSSSENSARECTIAINRPNKIAESKGAKSLLQKMFDTISERLHNPSSSLIGAGE
jgi:hypothetical protein